MVDSAFQKTVLDILSDFTGERSLRELCSELNYNYTNDPISTRNWAEKACSSLTDDPVVFARAGDNNDFHIVYTRLQDEKRLLLGHERLVISQLLKEHPYALFIFSNLDQDRWHFVNVKLVKGEEDELNKKPAKRRLFRRITISQDERLRTAVDRISMLDIEKISPDLFGLNPLEIQKRHDEAFDVEKVTKEFFDNYKLIFRDLQKDLEQQTDDRSWAHDYALQFLNRIMFLYFVQRKRWLGENPEFINTYWAEYKKISQPQDSFFSKWLSILFFEAFNKKFHGGHTHIPKNIQTILFNAPYLNGGLFTENQLDRKYNFNITDNRFEKVIKFFDQYNFTIAEDSPLDQEVAVDPEMIGKVYESLVNVSEEADERGEAGIFYTPRIEIDLMCRLSLVDNIANHLGKEYKSHFYEAVFAFDPEEKANADRQLTEYDLWQKIYDHLNEIKVLDPACGSGSFLVGMLRVINDLTARANTILGKRELPYDRKKRIIANSLYGVDIMKWAVDIAELRLWLQLVIDTEMLPEELTLQPLLPNLTFKIRQGDSLIQEVGGINFSSHMVASQDISQNLKGKLTALKGKKHNYYYNEYKTDRIEKEIKQEEFLVFKEILFARQCNLQNRIKQLKIGQISAFGDSDSDKISEKAISKIQTLTIELQNVQQAYNALKTVNDVLFIWDIAFVEIFESEKNGFDIVIGNPPYVRQENISFPRMPREQVTVENKKEYKNKLIQSLYQTYPAFFGYKPATGSVDHKLNAQSDLYIYFYFHCLDLLNQKGSFCFITSNSWLDVGYGKDLQEFLLKHCRVKCIFDNQVKRSFASSDVNTIIALFSSPDDSKPWALDHTVRFVMLTVPFEQILSSVIFEELEEAKEKKSTPEYRIHPITQRELLIDGSEIPQKDKHGVSISGPLIKVTKYIGNKWGGKYLRAPDIYWTILKKGKDKLIRLGDIAEVRRGITTGANEFFYLDEEKIRAWGIEEDFLKPVIKSPRECKRILIDPNDLKFKIFMCHKDKYELKGTAALEYIKWGESNDVHENPYNERPTCNVRKKWWWLPTESSNSIFVKEANETSAIFFNINNLLVDCRLYCANLPYLTLLYLNSPIGSLLFEIFNRAGLGEGARSLMVADYNKVPSLLSDHSENDKYCNILNSIFTLPPRNSLNPNQPEWQELDSIIYEEFDFTSVEKEAVYEAVKNLVENRLNKANSI